MRLHDLKPPQGSHRARKRLGRGNATGQGTTAGKGTKGQKARSGGLKAGFRGVSSRNARMPKRRGFTNIFKVENQVVKLAQLSRFESGSTVNGESLVAAGIIRDVKTPAKILGDGELTVALNVVGVKVSATAKEKIEAAGGSVAQPESAEEESHDSGGA